MPEDLPSDQEADDDEAEFTKVDLTGRYGRSSWSSLQKAMPLLHLCATLSPFFQWGSWQPLRTIPTLQRRGRSSMPPQASKDVPYSFQFPPMMKKPKWWWWTLACLPYLMLPHETWMHAETAYQLHPFLEDFEFFTYPFLGAVGSLPSWFLMAYFFVAYLGIVRKKECPHFFRFHVVMGILLVIALQVIGTVSRWMPLAIYWGKFGMHFWTAVAFAFLFTALETWSAYTVLLLVCTLISPLFVMLHIFKFPMTNRSKESIGENQLCFHLFEFCCKRGNM